MGAQMKGLQSFISDLRSAESKDAQDQRIHSEIVNIQKQFNNNDKLTGYQRKKYITKLIYIYLAASCNVSTFNVTFGSRQILDLVSSKVYTEKFTGYLAITLLGGENSDESGETGFINLLVNSLKIDLKSSDSEFNILALHFIASLGNGVYADMLIEDVFQVLRSPTSSPLLKKKAALALLKLAKANKDALTRHGAWIPRILSLVDDTDLGVLLSVLPLVEFIAINIDLEQVKATIPALTKKLGLLILEPDRLPQDYFFGKIANPWLIVKITKLLTVLLPDSDALDIDLVSLRILRDCAGKIIDFTTRSAVDQAARNAYNAVLFSVIDLTGHLNPSQEALASSIDAITKLLDSSDLNSRYLALESLINLSSKTKHLKDSQKHLIKIFQLMKEVDVSIAKKSLDLIYTLADGDSVNFIITELLKILKTSEHTIKQEVTIKVSILCEKFAKDSTWYIATMLELIQTSGSSLDPSIWERIVQIIANNENSQEIACKEVFKYLTKSKPTEAMIKIGAYILGEFGFLIKREIPIIQQFDVLANLYFFCSNNTRSMILFSFLNLLKYDIKNTLLRSNLIKILRLEVNSINSELQQRSYEYLTLISRLNTPEGKILFEIVFDELPVFNAAENPLLLRLSKTNPTAKKELVRSTDDLTKKLKQASLNPAIIEEDESEESADTTSNLIDPFGDDIASNSELVIQKDLPLTPNWEKGFYRLFEFNQGIFFESSLVKIILRITKSKDNRESIILGLSYINKSPQPITSLTTQLTNYKTVKPNLILKQLRLPDTDLAIEQRTNEDIEVLLRSNFTFDEIPNLRIQFNTGGAYNVIRLKLPIFLTNFITPTSLPFAQFLQNWKKIDVLGNSGESIQSITGVSTDLEWVERFVQKLGLAVMENRTDQFICGSGILHTSSQGSFGVLLKLKIVSKDSLEFRIRATSPRIAEDIGESIAKFFKNH